MATFIELTVITYTNAKRHEEKRLFSKYHITNIQSDERHSQSFLTYQDKEYCVIENKTEILNKLNSH